MCVPKRVGIFAVGILVAWVSSSSSADEFVQIIYRPSLELREVVEQARILGPDSRWSEVYWLVANFHGQFHDLPSETRRKVREAMVGDPRSWGHVAIRLPEGSLNDGNVFGWQADPEVVADAAIAEGMTVREITARFYRQHLLGDEPIVKGKFNIEDDWAFSDEFPSRANARAILIRVSSVELETIKDNIQRLTSGRNFYQLSPKAGNHYRPNSYNCVTVFDEIFRGTSVSFEFPRCGTMSRFVEEVERRYKPTQLDCSLKLIDYKAEKT